MQSVSELDYSQMREFEAQWLESHYDFNSIEGINRIPLVAELRCPLTNGETGKVYYHLRKTAYAHEENGNIDLAIACLVQSNQLLRLECCNFDPNSYYPLVRMLARNGHVERAIAEKASIDQFCNNSANRHDADAFLRCKKNCSILRTDLVIMSVHSCTCSECAKYQGRVYSLSGNDSRFPKLPDIFQHAGTVHSGCRHYFSPFIFGVTRPDMPYTLSVHPLQNPKYGLGIIQFSNRPFIDDRTAECKAESQEYFAKRSAEMESQKHLNDNLIAYEYQKWLDACTLAWLRENFPEKCPKSVTGYRRMRSQNTKNYQMLKQLAATKGREI